MKRISLGLSLTISLAGTIGSLVAGSKQAHIAFGMALTGLSLIHAFQNRKAMLGAWACKPVLPVRKPVLPRPDVLDRLPCVRNPFPGHGEVVFYIPGRIRLYIRELKGQEGYKKVLWETLEAFRQIGHLDMNSRTGSLLIVYDPEKGAALEPLRSYIRYAASHARRKGFPAG